VGYVEVVIVSIWNSENALTLFLQNQLEMSIFDGEDVIRLEPHTFEVVLARDGKSANEIEQEPG